MEKKILLSKTFFTFFVNGMMALMVGCIIPFIQNEYGFEYRDIGMFIALHAFGNLIAGFSSVRLIRAIGRKKASIVMSAFIPLAYIGILFADNTALLYFLFFMTGLGRGSVSNVDNFIVNDISCGRSVFINLLHMFFALGAFISPVLVAFVGWRKAVVTGIVFSLLMVIAYIFMDIDNLGKAKNIKTVLFYKEKEFYTAGFLLFFYLGAENCINGWLITYFKDSGIMSGNNAQFLLSVLWVVIIGGRLITGYMCEKNTAKETIVLVSSVVAMLAYIFMIRTVSSRIIFSAVMIFGFSVAGIYPTTISAVGNILRSDTAMGAIMIFSGLGGIIMPYIVGIIADRVNISCAMMVIGIDMTAVVIFAILLKIMTLNKKIRS